MSNTFPNRKPHGITDVDSHALANHVTHKFTNAHACGLSNGKLGKVDVVHTFLL
jgi:hypothetical protein